MKAPVHLPTQLLDNGGNLLGEFQAPPLDGQLETLVEGSPEFIRELERRQNNDKLITAEEAIRRIRAGFNA